MSGPAGSTRFWSTVDVVPAEGGYEVRLDNKPVRLPGAGTLLLSRRALADAIAAEWRNAGGGAPGGFYAPDALGLTRLAGTMLFRVGPERDAVAGRLLLFLDNDLLCYRATHPASLVAQQVRDWQPWLDWCSDEMSAELAVADGIMPLRQSPAAHEAIGRVLAAQDDAGLTTLGVLAPALGSLVLALACVRGALTGSEAHRLSLLDDHFQAERWGRDAEAEHRQAALLADCLEAERFLSLARSRSDTVLLVSGRVQGVGYRTWLQGEATRLGLRGWVRNLADGRVEARVSGADAARAALARLARGGPRMAAVRAVDVREETARPDVSEPPYFAIRHTASAQEPDAEGDDFIAESQ